MTEVQFGKKNNNPVFALQCLVQAFLLLTKTELRKFLIIPILINVGIYLIAFFVSSYYVALLIDAFIPAWLEWLSWLLWPLFFISFFIVGFFTFTLLANLIASPFYGKLAAKTLPLIGVTGEGIAEPPVHKILFSELKKLGYILLRVLPLLILSVIPGLNVFAPPLWLLFSAWSLALEYMAYPMENAGLLFVQQRHSMENIRFGSLSFGGLVAMGLAIPVVNVLMPPAAVIAATIFVNEAGNLDSEA